MEYKARVNMEIEKAKTLLHCSRAWVTSDPISSKSRGCPSPGRLRPLRLPCFTARLYLCNPPKHLLSATGGTAFLQDMSLQWPVVQKPRSGCIRSPQEGYRLSPCALPHPGHPQQPAGAAAVLGGPGAAHPAVPGEEAGAAGDTPPAGAKASGAEVWPAR